MVKYPFKLVRVWFRCHDCGREGVRTYRGKCFQSGFVRSWCSYCSSFALDLMYVQDQVVYKDHTIVAGKVQLTLPKIFDNVLCRRR